MPYFFSKNKLEKNKTVELDGEEARHVLLSHRVKVGELIKLQGPDGKRFSSQVLNVSRNSLTATSLEELEVPKELPVKITLFLSVVSEKALDFILQKATELGVAEVCLFNSKNTAVKLTKDLFNKKHLRWEKILSEAAKQCERGQWPVLNFIISTEELVKRLEGYEKIYVTDISGGVIGHEIDKSASCAVIVGPEGGLSVEELVKLRSATNILLIKLSSFILRTETAAISALSVINSRIL